MAKTVSTSIGIKPYHPNLGKNVTASEHFKKSPKQIQYSSNRDCACWCCQNNSKDGDFVGEFCAPCYELITTGRGRYGTSWIHQLKTRLLSIEQSLNKVRDIVENPYRYENTPC